MLLFSGLSNGAGKATITSGSQGRGQKKRYNSVLSPIYENVAYLDLEHYKLGNANQDKNRTARGAPHENVPFQAYTETDYRRKRDAKRLEREPGRQIRRRHSDHECVSCRESKYKRRIKLETVGSEDIPLKEVTCKFPPEKQYSVAEDQKNDGCGADRRVPLDKRRVRHTYSDPTCRNRARVSNTNYVGYNAIEKFLKDANFNSESEIPKLKAVRSNSEPIVKVPGEIFKNTLFIDAFDDKSKSLDDLNSNTADKILNKITDKSTFDTKQNSKRTETDFQPIEAFRDDAEKSTNSNSKIQDAFEFSLGDEVATTSKSITQSSLYQVNIFGTVSVGFRLLKRIDTTSG